MSKDGRHDAAFDFGFLPFLGFLSFVSFDDAMTANAISMLSPARAVARLSVLVVAGVLNSTLSVILLLLCWPTGTLTVLVEYPGVNETPRWLDFICCSPSAFCCLCQLLRHLSLWSS